MRGALFEVLMSKNCTPLWRTAHHKNTSKHFLKFWCRKIARHCGEKRVWLEVKTCKTPYGRGALFEVEMSKNCRPLWRTAHYEVKMLKNWGSGNTFWSSDVDKLHAAVAKSAFWSQNVQNTSCSEHFLKFWCRKNARRSGEKHILKSKCTKHLMLGALFEIPMSKNCTPLWREAHVQVKMFKKNSLGALFEVRMSKIFSVSKFVSQSISQLVN